MVKNKNDDAKYDAIGKISEKFLIGCLIILCILYPFTHDEDVFRFITWIICTLAFGYVGQGIHRYILYEREQRRQEEERRIEADRLRKARERAEAEFRAERSRNIALSDQKLKARQSQKDAQLGTR